MKLSLTETKQLKNRVEQILHVPGNYTGKILEMEMVVDAALPKETVKETVPELLLTLKRHSKVFQNVRFNYTLWISERRIENKVCPMMLATTSGFYEDYREEKTEKSYESLLEYLQKFQARSKLILFLTDGSYRIEDEDAVQEKMQPFLGKKLLILTVTEDRLEIDYRR